MSEIPGTVSERGPYIIDVAPGRFMWSVFVRARYGRGQARFHALSKDRALRKARRWCSRHAEKKRAYREAGPYIYEFDPGKESSDV